MNHSHYAANGNLTADPDLRFTPGGAAAASLSWAVNARYRNERGEWVDQDPSFVRGTVWGQLAEHVAESLSKGDRVVVIGQLVTQAWENEAGEKRSRLDVRVQAIGPDLTFVTAKIAKSTRSGVAKIRDTAEELSETEHSPF
jgi:single-strand DNA-binding protein